MSDSKLVYTIVERPGGKSAWVRIGRAFTNRDGSINVQLDAFPVNGSMQLRDADDLAGTVPAGTVPNLSRPSPDVCPQCGRLANDPIRWMEVPGGERRCADPCHKTPVEPPISIVNEHRYGRDGTCSRCGATPFSTGSSVCPGKTKP